MVVSRAQADHDHPEEEQEVVRAEVRQAAWETTPPNPEHAGETDNHKWEVAGDIPEIRNTEQRPLIGEFVIPGILRDGWNAIEKGSDEQHDPEQ